MICLYFNLFLSNLSSFFLKVVFFYRHFYFKIFLLNEMRFTEKNLFYNFDDFIFDEKASERD